MENKIKKSEHLKLVLAYLFLLFITTISFLPVLDNRFVNWDDGMYVVDNKHVKSGLTLEGLLWAFTTFKQANWHPLTWLSHMFDVEVYGLDPAGHHLSNLIFHLINTLLLLFALQKMTGALWRSAMVAALFAVHPLHVESVAWISERKDVLSTFFGLLTIVAYTRYVQHPGLWRYTCLFILLAMGLMAKPMLVTLPFVLLLLDYWPLQRTHKEEHSWLYLIREKIPLFVLSVLSCIVTFLAQKQSGALAPYKEWDISLRLANAFVSYTSYIIKMLVPQNLSVLYPLHKTFPIWHIAGSILLVVVISGISFWSVRRAPYFIIGWLWYLGTLFPVIGLIQVGRQSMADRYTYIPLIGLFIIVVWAIHDLFQKIKYRNIILIGLAIIVLFDFSIRTRNQTRYWRNSLILFYHALETTKNNWNAHFLAGHEYWVLGRWHEAVYHFEEAIRIFPEYTEALNLLGFTLIKLGKCEESIEYLQKSLQINPSNAQAHNYIGFSLTELKMYKKALLHFDEAARIDPDHLHAAKNAEKVRQILGKHVEDVNKKEK